MKLLIMHSSPDIGLYARAHTHTHTHVVPFMFYPQEATVKLRPQYFTSLYPI